MDPPQGGFFGFKERYMSVEEIIPKKMEAVTTRRLEMRRLASEATRSSNFYKPTLVHPEFLLGVVADTGSFPDYLLGGDRLLQEQLISENIETVVSMLPDIVASNHRLRSMGYMHTENPSDIKRSDEGLAAAARQYANVIQHTYPDGNGGTRYPLKQKNPQAIVDDVKKGNLDIYTVNNADGETVAVFGTVRRVDILGKKGYAIELGRTGTRADEAEKMNGAPLRGVSKLRLYHLLTDPRQIADPETGQPATFIYSDIRLAQKWNDDFPGGAGVQSVFFGGRSRGENLGFGIATVGWRYNLERTEPFAFIFRPTFPETYRKELEQKTLYIPDEGDARRIQTLMKNTFGTTPKITHNGSMDHVQPVNPDQIEVVLGYDAKGAGASDIFAKVDIVDTDSEMHRKLAGMVKTVSLSEALGQVKEGRAPFVEVYVDATLGDGVNAERITGIVKTLKELGFVCNGWVPSSRDGGNSILISFAKLGAGSNDPVPPDLPEKYYSNGLEDMRNEALQIFQDLADAGPLD